MMTDHVSKHTSSFSVVNTDHERLPAVQDYYTIGCKIGTGAFGLSSLWLARHKRENEEDFSLCVVHKTCVDLLATKDLESFQYLLQLSSKLQNPFILTFNSAFVGNDGFIWTIYPLFNYGSCSDVIRAEFKHGLPITLVGMILLSVLRALEYLHKMNYVHRSIKGSHILLHSNGSICLSGLRYCLAIPEEKKRLHLYPDHAKNILPWVAPEILQQNLNGYDEKSDIYSVGITIVELVTGTIPFNKLKPTEVLLQKLRGVVPELPDKAILEELHSDFSASQTSLEGLEQTNDMMCSPSPHNNLSARKIRSLQQFVENCVQTDPEKRLTAYQLRHSTCMRNMKRKIRDKDIEELLRPLSPIKEFIPLEKEKDVRHKISSFSMGDQSCWIFD